jgi:hypothetical protein
METALTHTGRGRSPLFESVLRAQLLEKGPQSYDLATMGSYRTFTPDSYELGYYLVAMGSTKYGSGVWDEANNRIARYPFMVVPFSSGIRKTTGFTKTGLYRDLTIELSSAWKIQDTHVKTLAPDTLVQPESRNHDHYYQPHFESDTSIIAEKTSLDDIARFIRINPSSGKTTSLVVPGIRTERSSSTGNQRLVWAELRFHPRWQNESYSEIRLLELPTGESRFLTQRSRFFSPDISDDGSRIVAVENSETGANALVIMDAGTGKVIDKIASLSGHTVMNPSWNGNDILYVIQNQHGQSIARINPENKTTRVLMPFSWNEIYGKPVGSGKNILFSSALHGIANIYALDTASRQVYQVTGSRFAATGVSVSEKKGILFTEYTAGGTAVCKMTLNRNRRILPDSVNDHSLKLHETIARQEGINVQDQLLKQPDTIHPSSGYPKILHLFNFHSWAPLSFSAGNTDFSPGVMALSQNLLSTMFLQAGWAYDLNEQTGKWYMGLSYQGLYPVIDFSADYGKRAGKARYHNFGKTLRFEWRETNLKLHLRIPWNFSRGRWVRTIEPKAGITMIGVEHLSNTPESFVSGWITSLDYRLAASQYQRRSTRDLATRFGQSLEVNYRHSPFSHNSLGSIIAVAGKAWFPSLFRHHSLNFYAGYQQYTSGDPISYTYSSMIRIPRGYEGIFYEQMVSVQGNYAFPVCYPDWSLWSVVYFKRLKINLFYDFTRGIDPGVSDDYSSTGAELMVDLHLLRFLAPVEFGVRATVYPTENDWGWEFLYAVGLP